MKTEVYSSDKWHHPSLVVMGIGFIFEGLFFVKVALTDVILTTLYKITMWKHW